MKLFHENGIYQKLLIFSNIQFKRLDFEIQSHQSNSTILTKSRILENKLNLLKKSHSMVDSESTQ